MAKDGLSTLKKFRWTINGMGIKPAVNVKVATLMFKFAGKRKLPPSGNSELCLNTGV